MNRRTFIVALLGTPAVAAFVVACGDDAKQSSNESVSAALDEVVLRIGYRGGYVAPGTDFVSLPTLLVTGDGRVFTPGVTAAVFPGPLLAPLLERSITREGIDALIAHAAGFGLLAAAPDYALVAEPMVADASDTVVELTVDGNRYEHRAYALGFEADDANPSSPARDNLQRFVDSVADLASVVGAENLGMHRPFAPDRYKFQAMVVDPTEWADPSPTVAAWPADTGVELASATDCASLAAGVGDGLFLKATQLTFFREDDLVYRLAVAGVLPGDTAC